MWRRRTIWGSTAVAIFIFAHSVEAVRHAAAFRPVTTSKSQAIQQRSHCSFPVRVLAGYRDFAGIPERIRLNWGPETVPRDKVWCSAATEASSSSSGPTTTTVTLTVPPFDHSNNTESDTDTSYPSVLHHIHVGSLMSSSQALHAWELAKTYAAATGRWEKPDSERHASYATCDFAIEDCAELDTYLQEKCQFDQRLFQLVNEKYGIPINALSYLDFFCVNYKSLSEGGIMDRLEAHRDGSLVSFTVLLSPPDNFEGGGTFFDSLRDLPEQPPYLAPGGVIRPTQAGDVTLHCGKLLHGAHPVTRGERTVLVGFVDVAEEYHRDGALSQACRDWGRMDEAKRRYQRQLARTTTGSSSEPKKSWHLNNQKWIATHKDGQSTAIRNVAIAFPSVKNRAEDEYQRQIKLKAEDRLLRSILLSEPKELDGPLEIFDGDITVL